MAPPLVPKRALPPDPPDAGNRVSKPKSTSSRSCGISLLARSTIKSAEASLKAKAIERALSVARLSTDASETLDESMDVLPDVPSSDSTDSVCADVDFNTTNNGLSSSDNWDTTSTPHKSASLMDAIKGLLDLTTLRTLRTAF
ncbi:hypothetical protein K3495_g2704 [Podosphaera aphanis]|nr:hypothetical protein K3495_g2704 [Podosphaera aphanis]